MAIAQKTKIISIKEAKSVHYMAPLSWRDAAGIIKDKRIDALKYQKEIRREWSKRLKKQASKTKKAEK